MLFPLLEPLSFYGCTPVGSSLPARLKVMKERTAIGNSWEQFLWMMRWLMFPSYRICRWELRSHACVGSEATARSRLSVD